MSTTERVPDLEFEFQPDGSVRLRQGWDEPVHVDVHAAQLRLLAERAGLIEARQCAMVDRLIPRFDRLLRDAEYLGDDVWLDEITERLGDGFTFAVLVGHAVETLRDLVGELRAMSSQAPARNGNADLERNENSATGISVTASETPRRGRPPTGNALSNAERQARHRQKQTTLGLEGSAE